MTLMILLPWVILYVTGKSALWGWHTALEKHQHGSHGIYFGYTLTTVTFRKRRGFDLLIKFSLLTVCNVLIDTKWAVLFFIFSFLQVFEPQNKVCRYPLGLPCVVKEKTHTLKLQTYKFCGVKLDKQFLSTPSLAMVP